MTLIELNNKVQAFDLNDEITKILSNHSEELLDLNKQQMWDGKRADGENITPSYSQNPYFKKPGAAERYANWKAKITPSSIRPMDVPNLFINGKFYDSLSYSANDWVIKTTSSLGEDVISIHKNVLGIMPENSKIFNDEILTPELTEAYQKAIG